MTILHLISSGGFYGAEAVILNLARVLNDGGEHRCVLGVFNNGSAAPRQLQAAAETAGVELHEIRCRGQVDRAVPARIRELVGSTGADVLHAHGYKADVYAALALRGSPCALVSTCHTWYDNDLAVRVYGAVDRFVLRGFAGVVAVSGEVRTRLLRAGVRRERIRLIRNGVDLRPFAASQQQTRRGRGALLVGLVGRLAPEKGIDVFLQSVARLLREQPELVDAGTQFRIVGEGPERAVLEVLRDSLGLTKHVTFAGHCSDMPTFYASLDVLVSSSRQEGLPIALLEGMASGLPLLATGVGEVPLLARPQDGDDAATALLVPPGDPAALAEGMACLLADASLRQAMGAAARQLIAREFSAEAMAAEYVDVYRAVLPANPGVYTPRGREVMSR